MDNKKDWEVAKIPLNALNGKNEFAYQLYRIRDKTKPDYTGNREWGAVFDTEKKAKKEAAKLNKIYKPYVETQRSNVTPREFWTHCDKLMKEYNLSMNEISGGFNYWENPPENEIKVNNAKEWYSAKPYNLHDGVKGEWNYIITSTTEAANIDTELEVYAGPGTNYVSMGTVNKRYIKKAVKIENDWLEIESNGMRGYIPTKSALELCTNDVPRVVHNISQNVTLYPQILNINVNVKLYDDAEVYRSPSNTESTETIKAGETIRFLCIEKNKYNEYAQFEINANGRKWRAYSDVSDLLSLDNPLKDFENVKKTNGIIYYNGKNYYSSTGIAKNGRLGRQWKLVAEKSLVKTRFDILAGLQNMIAANSNSCDDIVRASGGQYKDYKFYNLQHNRYENVSFENSKMSNAISIADAFIGNAVSFMEGGNKGVFFKIDLLECDGEHKIVIRTDKPIESVHAGKKTTLDYLLVERDSTNFVKKADDKAIKKMYPNLKQDKTYSMEMIFSNNFQDNPYGYYIIFDKNLSAYAIPIIHSGTSFNVYSEHKILFDVARDLARCIIPMKDEDSMLLREMLKENGFQLSATPVKNNRKEIIKKIEENNNPTTEINMLRRLVGTYQGSYFPTQGETGLTLTICEENQKFKALFDFYSLPGRKNSQSGKYYMNVTYNKRTNQYILNGYQWIERPKRYSFANLKGILHQSVDKFI